MSRPVMIAAFLAASGSASADQPDHAFDETERLEHWSWVPLVSAQLAFDSAVEDQTSGVFGAQLRVRHGTARAANAYHPQDPIRLWSFGVGVETVAFDTVEPQLSIGRHWLPKESEWWGGPVFLDLRVDVGVGYAFGGAGESPFFTIKAGAGAMLTRENPHTYLGRHGPVGFTKLRFRQQLDLVLETHVATTGEWRLGIGLELDLARVLTDLVSDRVL